MHQKLNYQYSKDKAYIQVIVVSFQFALNFMRRSTLQKALLCQLAVSIICEYAEGMCMGEDREWVHVLLYWQFKAQNTHMYSPVHTWCQTSLDKGHTS